MCPYLEDLIEIAERLKVLSDLHEDSELMGLANKIITKVAATEQYYDDAINEISYGGDY